LKTEEQLVQQAEACERSTDPSYPVRDARAEIACRESQWLLALHLGPDKSRVSFVQIFRL